MKKNLFLITVMVLAVGTVCGQRSALHGFNISAGVNAANMDYRLGGDDLKSTPLWGINVGFGYNLPLSNKRGLSFETGLRLNQLGGYVSTNDITMKKEVYYASLPTLLNCRITLNNNISLMSQIGLTWSFGINAKEYAWGQFDDILVTRNDPWITDDLFTCNNWHQLRRFDIGAVVGVGAAYKTFQLTMGYLYGLLNATVFQGDEAHNRSLFITLGLGF